jgi:hypothetical protein
VTPEELLEPANKALAEELDKVIDEKIGKFRTDKEVAEELGALFGPSGDLYDGDLDPFDEIEAAEEAALMLEADEWTPETFDKYLAAEVLLPHGGELVRAKVTGRKRASDGTPVGVSHSNPILDTREYEVSFPDGSTDCYAANMIAESLYSQVDSDGREYMLMKEIVDHRSDGSAVPVDDAYYVAPNGRTTRRMTTKGWKLLVEWKDGSTDCGSGRGVCCREQDRRTAGICLVGTVRSQEARADHPEVEVPVLEAHSQVRGGTPEECEASARDRQEHGDPLLDGRD